MAHIDTVSTRLPFATATWLMFIQDGLNKGLPRFLPADQLDQSPGPSSLHVSYIWEAYRSNMGIMHSKDASHEFPMQTEPPKRAALWKIACITVRRFQFLGLIADDVNRTVRSRTLSNIARVKSSLGSANRKTTFYKRNVLGE